MDRRSAFVTVALPGSIACAFAQASFAPLIGSWKLNLERSKYAPGAAPRSQTISYQQNGENIKTTTRAQAGAFAPFVAAIRLGLKDAGFVDAGLPRFASPFRDENKTKESA
jgi:hypothetical protein